MAHRLGYEVARKPRAMMEPGAEIIPTIELLAPYLSSILTDVTFVQVGAYDGEANDPLVETAVRYGWRGVLVEPQHGPFSRLQALHAGRHSFQLRRAAVGAADGMATLYTIRPQPGLPDWAYQNASFSRAHILKTQPNLDRQGHAAEIEEQQVESVTFDRLLTEAGLGRVDVLQIGCGGARLRDPEALPGCGAPSAHRELRACPSLQRRLGVSRVAVGAGRLSGGPLRARHAGGSVRRLTARGTAEANGVRCRASVPDHD